MAALPDLKTLQDPVENLMTKRSSLGSFTKLIRRERMEFIDINSIKTNNKYLRLDTDVEKLKKSIETVGIINPLTVNLNDELISGGRRFTALKALGVDRIPVNRVEKSLNEQELISIDENLVRQDLTKIELEEALSRGRELYEEIYPNAKKVAEEDLTLSENQEIQIDTPNEERSFIDITAEKTGLSKKVIKSAIDREERSSNKVKELRRNGDLNASQTNEIIKLSKEDQETMADILTGKSAKEVKDIVKKVNQVGVNATIHEIETAPILPNEYKSLKTLLQRTNKVLAKILLEEMTSEHDDVHSILDQVSTLRMSLDQLLVLASNTNKEQASTDSNALEVSQEDYSNLVQEGLDEMRNTEADY